MHLPAAYPGAVFQVTNTTQFDHWLTIFRHGIKVLQDQSSYLENEKPFSSPKVSALTQALLNIAKALSVFLEQATTAQSPPYLNKRPPHEESIWMKTAIADLRVECHRYSWATLQIATGMEKRIAKAERKREILSLDNWWSPPNSATLRKRRDAFSDSVGIETPLVSPTSSVYSATSIQSWWSESQPLLSAATSHEADDEGSEDDDDYCVENPFWSPLDELSE